MHKAVSGILAAVLALVAVQQVKAAASPVIDIHLTQRVMFTERPDSPSDHDATTPYELVVTPGTTVNWYVESGKHTIVADDGSFNSGLLTTGMTYEHCFDHPGNVSFHDDFHLGGPQKALRGTIHVVAATKP